MDTRVDGSTKGAYDEFDQALGELDKVLGVTLTRIAVIRARITLVRAAYRSGRLLRQAVPIDGLIVRQLAIMGNELALAGARVRRTQARALIDEGLSPQEIADAFQVSRQRISKILQGEGDSTYKRRD